MKNLVLFYWSNIGTISFSWFTDWVGHGHTVTIPFGSSATVTLSYTQRPGDAATKLKYSYIKNGSTISGSVDYGLSVTVSDVTSFTVDEVDWSSASSSQKGIAKATMMVVF